MDRQEVLEKSRCDGLDGDERERLLEVTGGQVGLLVIALAAAVLSLVKTFMLHTPGSDLMMLAFLGLGASSAYQHRHTGRSICLAAAILYFLCGLGFAIGYIASLNGITL